MIGKAKDFFKQNVKVEEIRRAETRQAFTALYLLGKKPRQSFKFIPKNEEEIDRYLIELDWSRPWGAGSHFSHLLFFLKMNAKLFDYQIEESDRLISHAVNWIWKIQSDEDGSWYKGNEVPLQQKINGAMKVITGFQATGIKTFPFADKLIDTALSGINDKEACSNFNIVYVLYFCHKIFPEYRFFEIQEFLKSDYLYKDFYHFQAGGFSFHKNRANDIYYGKKITVGKNEPDIHGTCMFLWGISLMDEVLDLGLKFRVPIN